MALIKEWKNDGDWNTGVSSGDMVIAGDLVLLDSFKIPCADGTLGQLIYDTGQVDFDWGGIELNAGFSSGENGKISQRLTFFAGNTTSFGGKWKVFILKYTDNPSYEVSLPIILDNDRFGNPFIGRYCRIDLYIKMEMFFGWE